MRIGSLFSGYGGLDLAVKQIFPHAEVAWHCEFDKSASAILEHNYPTVPNLGDVTKINWQELPPIDVLTAGYPCQPFSAAGKRKGTNDNRHLWPYVRQAIRNLRPKFTLLENVSGHRSLGFGDIQRDLAEDGLNARWVSLRCSDVGGYMRGTGYLYSLLPTPTASDCNRNDCPADARRKSPGITTVSVYFPVGLVRFGKFRELVERWSRITRNPPDPVEVREDGKRQISTRFIEWMMGLPDGWVTAVPGVSRREQLKALGNGVVPQQGAKALEILLQGVECQWLEEQREEERLMINSAKS